ncbi:EF-hand calcium-binding domain-containing protein 1 isoform X1 [Carcharodon carcharias]|uniref:EF-hand calcium-binding domain-containing protein 1 isoform X1 n=1 Tax=Carcharodon carcharias TaxID=13397 RepID=UPI001B7F6333|nr:EF-hand calcium-binding domain-containing protein 1 isoform X1 [Carcharodon carcharias]
MSRIRPLDMSRKQYQQLADTLCKLTKRFNRHEVQCLMKVFSTLVATFPEQRIGIGLDRNKFRNILHTTFGMTDDMIMDRVFRAFDKDNDSYVNMREWIEGLSIFLRGTLDEKIKFCFDVFDLNGDGFISREEMFHMLKSSLIKQPTEEDPDEGVKDLVEIALKKMDRYCWKSVGRGHQVLKDYDHDNKVSYVDFEKAVKVENLLLEAFGPCLPDSKKSIMRKNGLDRSRLVAAGCKSLFQMEEVMGLEGAVKQRRLECTCI